MATLQAKLIAILSPHSFTYSSHFDGKPQINGLHYVRARGMSGKFRNNVIIPPNRAMRERFQFPCPVLFHGRAHSHFLDYGTDVWKNDVKLYGEENSLLA